MTNNSHQWTPAGFVLRVTWQTCRCGERNQRQGFYKLLLSTGPNGSTLRRYVPHHDPIPTSARVDRVVDSDHIPICNSCFDLVVSRPRATLDEANWRMAIDRRHRKLEAEAKTKRDNESGKINLFQFADIVEAHKRKLGA